VAFAGARFVDALLQAITTKKNVVECTYISSNVAESYGLDYFSTKVEIGPEGVNKIHPIPKLNEYEMKLLKDCVSELKGSIIKGVEFVNKKVV
jgi:malate dehydrogenase